MIQPDTDSPAVDRRLLDSLRTDCQEQMAQFRSTGSNNPASCLEIFRRAILRRDPTAWEALVAIYTPFVERWICRRGFSAGPDHLEELVQQALVRFWRAYTPEQFARAHSLGEILRYWQDCAITTYLDWLRRTRKPVISFEETDGRPAPGMRVDRALHDDVVRTEARARLWLIVKRQCQDEIDEHIAHRVFVEGRKPRDVLRENPDRLEDVTQVYRRLRNLKDRLRRTPDLAELLEILG